MRGTDAKSSKRSVEVEVYNRFAYVTSNQEKNTIYNVTQRYYNKDPFYRRYERALEAPTQGPALALEPKETVFQGAESVTSYYAHLGRYRAAARKLCFEQSAAVAAARNQKATERTGRAKSASKVPPVTTPMKELVSPTINGHKVNESPAAGRIKNPPELISPSITKRTGGMLDLLSLDANSPVTPGLNIVPGRRSAQPSTLSQAQSQAQPRSQEQAPNPAPSSGVKSANEDLLDMAALDFLAPKPKQIDLAATVNFLAREKLSMQVKENKVKDLRINGQVLLEAKGAREECPPLRLDVASPAFGDPNRVQRRLTAELSNLRLVDLKSSELIDYLINPKILEPEQIPLLVNTREDLTPPNYRCVIQYRTNESVRDVEIQVFLRAGKTLINVEDVRTEPTANKVTSETIVWRSRQIKKESRGKIELAIKNASEKMIDHIAVMYRKESLLLPDFRPTLSVIGQDVPTLPAEEKFLGEYKIIPS
eukprot:TRINITY_DN9092_c0_g1_i4.p1 TRINITY_DN9092_c0_g1~~TRINITY_DN9092_c0_g1_i4.p1  ORF type:complete len:481 (+),score=71.88 TRINITY_DN9092_c0_g1_i4:481-1923(+)